MDARGRQWFLCDLCDAAVTRERAFLAPAQDHLADSSGAWYCRACALDVVNDWREQLSAAEETPSEVGA